MSRDSQLECSPFDVAIGSDPGQTRMDPNATLVSLFR
jgi:hypothetical protein